MVDAHRQIKLMGIINLNEDSFYAPSRYNISILDSGADIIDIGGISTRPGAENVSEEEEWRRISQFLKGLDTKIEISLDTTRSTIVERAADLLGRSFIVNDISAGEEDSRMLETVATLKLGYIAMHKRGTPKTMMDLCHYNDVVKEVQDYFIDFQSRCPFQSWIMDPGFGFAKDLKQNYELLSKLGLLRMEGHPLLVGISRKSFIYKALNITTEEALCPTQALHMAALERGADILRVHDVKEARETLELYRRLNA